MKPLFFLFIFACTYAHAQIAPNPGTPQGTTPVPINPGQTSLPYNGTNPAGEPNQSTTYTNSMPGGNYQPAVQPNPVQPITTPSIGDTHPFHRLFQDPVRTPRDPKAVDPEHHSADGSGGKYHKPKKAMSGKTFAHNRIGVKTAKKHGDNAPEKTRAKTPAASESTH